MSVSVRAALANAVAFALFAAALAVLALLQAELTRDPSQRFEIAADLRGLTPADGESSE